MLTVIGKKRNIGMQKNVRKFINRAKYVVSGEDADLNVQWLILLVVAILIFVGVRFFGDEIVSALQSLGGKVKSFEEGIDF